MINRKGFTLIELIMVIIILAVLAVVAIPKFTDYSTDANDAAEKGVVGGVRAGITAAYLAADPKAYPATLDSASDGDCTSANICFDTVLAQGGITSDWSKAGLVYTGPAGNTYTYVPATGVFQ